MQKQNDQNGQINNFDHQKQEENESQTDKKQRQHYGLLTATQKSGILNGGDVSEIAIVFSYVCYVILYIKVIQMRKENIIESSFKGILCPILAMLGSAIILIGGVISNPFYVILFIIIGSLVCGVGYNYYKDTNNAE